MIYVDASHSNPDVFIDYENLYKVLRPGGVMAVDDTHLEPVAAAFGAFLNKYGLSTAVTRNARLTQAFVQKPLDDPLDST